MQPGELVLREHEAQTGIMFQHLPENQIREEPYRFRDVPPDSDMTPLHGRYHLEPRSISALRDIHMEMQRNVHILSHRPQRIINRVGVALPVRKSRGKNRAFNSELGTTFHLLDRPFDIERRKQTQGEKPVRRYAAIITDPVVIGFQAGFL